MNRQVRAAWAEYHRTLRLRTGRAGPHGALGGLTPAETRVAWTAEHQPALS